MWRKFPRSISAANLVTEISSSDYRQQIDLAAVIDANKRSPTYGKIVNTASIPCIPKDNVHEPLRV